MKRYYTGKRSPCGGYYALVYHYSPDGERELLDFQSNPIWDTKEEAEEAAAIWCEDNDVDAEME